MTLEDSLTLCYRHRTIAQGSSVLYSERIFRDAIDRVFTQGCVAIIN
ncbi:hypothetical protein HUN01_11575 [Nostoc edaphicum CCNP1411]|uniref:Uncharacterized protein n=1 Tax=Nostoc edaphicum CCNP1411 TaxID=1472755 RepID=A0A7D7QIW4_9NOSO|nr:hypothetical protein [Nostoc edaphicum]QMS88201.1 hypothetical protein HUN01_11575 [Nostoc edaphicum CCNP1411]